MRLNIDIDESVATTLKITLLKKINECRRLLEEKEDWYYRQNHKHLSLVLFALMDEEKRIEKLRESEDESDESV